MSDDIHEPNPELEATLPLEHAEELESEMIEHGKFDDASDDFAYEESDDSDESDESADEFADGDVEAFDYDGPPDEMIAESEDVGGELQAKPKRNRASKSKKQEHAEALEDSSDFADEFDGDGDNDPSPGERLAKHQYSGAAKFAPQRLAKILAAAGIDARRKCEEYVTSGRVSVDGEVITDVAFRADPYSQKIELDGEKIKLQRKVYFALNKPRGVVCTNHDPSGRPRVIDLFPQFRERIFAIGRLDEESEGLLLVTNDGELANRMAHPRYRVAKFYLCHVKGVPTAETLASLKRGMYFDEGRFHVEGVRLKKAVGDSSYLEIVLNEGQNREIRRLMARVGHKVMRLKRVGFGPIRLGDLPAGAYRALASDEMKLLQDLSEQRAHLDNTAGRGRKKKFGDKPAFGSKPRIDSKPPVGKPAYGQPPRGGKPAYGKPAYGQSKSGTQPSYGDRPPRGKFGAMTDEQALDLANSGEVIQDETRERRPAGRPRPGGYSQGGYGVQGGQRRDTRRNDGEQLSGPPRGQRRPPRRDDAQGDAQQAPRRYPSRGATGDGQGPPRGRTGYGQGAPGNRRGYSQDQGGGQQGGDSQQRGYSSRPPYGGQGGTEGDQRPPRRYQDEQPPRRYQNDQVAGAPQPESTDNDFGGGRRRFVTEDTPESSFSQRPARPPRPAGARPPRPVGGERPQRRRYVSDDATAQQGSTGGYSAQRRPAGGPRGYGQAGNRELPARGRGQRPAPPPRPMTADGKEILQGKVTGYRTAPKEGIARRRKKAVDGMQINRKQRQQRRKKTDE